MEALGIRLDALDLTRPVAIHRHPCKHCPSALSPPDDITLDYMAAPRAEQLDSVFRCAWRRQKACKGYCDLLGVTESDLAAAFSSPEEQQR